MKHFGFRTLPFGFLVAQSLKFKIQTKSWQQRDKCHHLIISNKSGQAPQQDKSISSGRIMRFRDNYLIVSS